MDAEILIVVGINLMAVILCAGFAGVSSTLDMFTRGKPFRMFTYAALLIGLASAAKIVLLARTDPDPDSVAINLLSVLQILTVGVLTAVGVYRKRDKLDRATKNLLLAFAFVFYPVIIVLNLDVQLPRWLELVAAATMIVPILLVGKLWKMLGDEKGNATGRKTDPGSRGIPE